MPVNREVSVGEFRHRVGSFPSYFYLTYYGERVGIVRKPSSFRRLDGFKRYSWYTLRCTGMRKIVEHLRNGEMVVVDVRSDRSWIMEPI